MHPTRLISTLYRSTFTMYCTPTTENIKRSCSLGFLSNYEIIMWRVGAASSLSADESREWSLQRNDYPYFFVISKLNACLFFAVKLLWCVEKTRLKSTIRNILMTLQCLPEPRHCLCPFRPLVGSAHVSARLQICFKNGASFQQPTFQICDIYPLSSTYLFKIHILGTTVCCTRSCPPRSH